MDAILNNLEKILAVIGCLYILFSVIATITPSKKDDKIASKIGRLFDKLGFNPRLIFEKEKKK